MSVWWMDCMGKDIPTVGVEVGLEDGFGKNTAMEMHQQSLYGMLRRYTDLWEE